MKELSLFAAVCLIFFLVVSSGYSLERFQANANFDLGFPQDEFKENVDRTSIGGMGFFIYKIPRSPLRVGLSLGLQVYGNETREEPISSAIPDVFVDVKTRNYMLMCHLLLRIQPKEGRLLPYFDGLVGFHYLWTQTGIYSQSGLGLNKVASTVHLSDTALSYGAGGGLMVRVYEKRGDKSKSTIRVYTDFGIRYLKGGKAEYMREGSILLEDDRLVYDIRESKTNIIMTYIGVTFAF